MSFLLLLASAAAPPSALDRPQVEAIVREYILAHPEILPEAIERLRTRETAKAIAANRAVLFTPFGSAWEGAADADVTLVQFFDYACGHCRNSRKDVARLLAEDGRLRVVYREFPVLGEFSEAASRVSLAAAKTGKWRDAHQALYALAPDDLEGLKRLSAKYGMGGDDGDQEVARNLGLARPLQITGTPSWVVGDQLLSGDVGYDALKAAVAAARQLQSGR